MMDSDLLEEKQDPVRVEPKLTLTGKLLLGVTGCSVALFSAVATPFLLPAVRRVCLPFVPATDRQVQNVIRLIQPSAGGTLIDLGSGDGRIVIEAARHGFRSTGVELNPWLVWYSRWRAWHCGQSSKAAFSTCDLFKVDLRQYNNIVIFGVPSMMEMLEEKLGKELTDNGQVIACRFPLPNWKPVQTIEEGIDTVWLYRRSASRR